MRVRVLHADYILSRARLVALVLRLLPTAADWVRMVNVFLKPATGNGLYVSRSAVLCCHHLESLLIPAEAAAPVGSKEPIELAIPDLPRSAFLKVMEHCERPHADESADQAMVESLELEILLQLVGVSHKLGALSLLNLSSTRVAGLLSEAACAAPGERAGRPMDAYLRRDPNDALGDDEAISTADEFIFMLPDAEDAPSTCSSPAAAPPTLSNLGRNTGGRMPSTVPFNAHMVRSGGSAAGKHGNAGTGGAGEELKGGLDTGADRLVQLLGGEAPLLAVLVKLGLQPLRTLKTFGRCWRYRARSALCSGAWAEAARSLEALDLGRTRHWRVNERTAAARFLSNGGCARLEVLKADGFKASLQSLKACERFSAATLLQAVMISPAGPSEQQAPAHDGASISSFRCSLPDADSLCAQSEFLSLLALWTLGSSTTVREADVSALTYTGMLPLVDALGPAVELATRRTLEKVFISSSLSALPVRDLVGLPPPPPPVSAPLGSAPLRDRITATTVDLKWKGLGALDASLIASLLRANRSITYLNLSWNSGLKATGSRGAEDLLAAIAQSRTLQDVDLSGTGLGEGLEADLRKLVAASPALTRLSLRSCGLGAATRDVLARAVNERRAGSLLDLTM